MYNVLAKLRAGEPLSKAEKIIHEQGLVSVLRQLHDELDAAVFDAYGWPAPSTGSGCALTDEEILERLVALNAERAAEEAQGHIRWLRPKYQAPADHASRFTQHVLVKEDSAGDEVSPGLQPPLPWPDRMAEQAQAVRGALAARPARQARLRLPRHSPPRRRIASPSCWRRWSRWGRRARRPRGGSWGSRGPFLATEPQATRIGCCTGGFSSKLSAPRGVAGGGATPLHERWCRSVGRATPGSGAHLTSPARRGWPRYSSTVP